MFLLPLVDKVATICVLSQYYITLILFFLLIRDKQFMNEISGSLHLITPEDLYTGEGFYIPSV
jgi:hypothetical protein